MPKLPDNTLKFDSPLRRTSRASAATPSAVAADDVAPLSTTMELEASSTIDATETAHEGAPVIALPRPRREGPTPEAAGSSSLEHRITVRIDEDINRALELERHERRLAGEKTNVADVARKALATWAKRRLARDRS